MDRVVRPPPYPITAWAVCTALGATTRETLGALREGHSGLRPSPFDLPFETLCGALDPLPPPLTASLARYNCRASRILNAALDEVAPSIEQTVRRRGGDRVAVIFGTTASGLDAIERAFLCAHEGVAAPGEFNLATQNLHTPSDLLRARFKLRGPAYSLASACASGAKVFAAAQRLLDLGLVDAAVVGGVDALTLTTVRGFHALGLLSRARCRPFARGRDGVNLGEGAAVFVIEREGDSRAALLGVGESNDGHHFTAPHPEGAGAREAMRAALAQAGVRAAEVDYINAHGTGTPKNDLAECAAIEALFGRATPVASTKGATGHALGAAGAIEVAFALAAVEQGWIPESAGAVPLDPEVAVRVSTRAEARPCAKVLSNSFGFGGSNASVLVGAS